MIRRDTERLETAWLQSIWKRVAGGGSRQDDHARGRPGDRVDVRAASRRVLRARAQKSGAEGSKFKEETLAGEVYRETGLCFRMS